MTRVSWDIQLRTSSDSASNENYLTMKTSQTLQVETFSDILKQYQAEKTFFPPRINRSVGNHLINKLWLRATMLQVWYCSVVAVSQTIRLSTSTSTRPRGSLMTRSAKPTSVSRVVNGRAYPARFLEKPSKSTSKRNPARPP